MQTKSENTTIWILSRVARDERAAKLASILVLLLCVWASRVGTARAEGVATAAKDSREQPNFLFIFADDQAPHTLGCYGNQVCQTPNIDRLAREGLMLHDARHMGSWSGAVCTPSRTMVMTGMSVWRIPGSRGPGIELPENYARQVAENCMAAVFNRGGYVTMRTCKNGNSFKLANEKFMVKRTATKRQGTEEDGSAWHADQVMDFLKARQFAKTSRGRSTANMLTENQSAMIDEAGEEKIAQRPFLVYFGFSHPHDPRHALPELAEKYGADNRGPQAETPENAPPLQINYLPAHPFPHGHPGLRDEVNVPGVKKRRDVATVRNELGREYACIENIDNQVGRILDELESMGELDNTYVFFTADHGIAVGRHGLMGKQNLYEHTWRVPFVVKGPGIAANSTAPGSIYLMDVMPTMCELAGIEIPEQCDGTSFASVLRGEKQAIRETMFGVYCGGTKPGMRSVKQGDWKLIEYDTLDGKVRKTQLFNLAENPDELLIEHHVDVVVAMTGNQPEANQQNLAGDEQYRQQLMRMRELLKSEMSKWGDPYMLEQLK